MKALSSTEQLPLKLLVLNGCEVVGMCSVAVKCLDITQNTDSEGMLLVRLLTLRDESVGSEQD